MAKAPHPLQFAQEIAVPKCKDAKARLASLLAEYAEQYAELEELWHHRKPDLKDLVLVPGDVAETEELLQKWHESIMEDALRLDAGEVALKLHWDELSGEVVAAGRPFGGLAQGAEDFAVARLLRRQGALRMQRYVLQAIRQQEGEASSNPRRRNSKSTAGSPAQRALSAINSELEMGFERLRLLRQVHEGRRIHAPLMSTSTWRGAAVVLLRQMLLEDTATKDLRHFLLQLQYLGFASRRSIWRKSLEHRAVAEIACEGSTAGWHRVIQSNLAPLLSVPLGPTNRKRLERTLQDWAVGFSLSHASMQPDRGKTFAHQVGLSFPELFDHQQQKWQFSVYPITTCLNATEPAGMPKEGHYLRPSGWTEHLRWTPKLADELVEQRILLDASYARRSTPSRVTSLSRSVPMTHRSQPSYARRLLDQAAADLGNGCALRGIVDGGDAAVDSLLGHELSALRLADAALAARRLNERAEEPVGGPGAQEFAAQQVGEKVPQHLLRAYYMLAYLKSRSCRWRLLSVLNFFRFVQRRLLVATATFVTEMDEGKGSEYIGQDSDLSQRVEEKAQDKYWDISSRGLSRILRHCSLPFTTEAPGGLDPSKLDKETFKKHDDEIEIWDSSGRKVFHEAALEDLEALELDMLKLGSYYIHKYEATRADEREVAVVDRSAVLYDLLTSEVWFQNEKQSLVEVYLNIFEDTMDPMEQRLLAQRIMDVMALRPRLDLQDPYFVEAYGAAILALRARGQLLKELQQHQANAEVVASKRAMGRAERRAGFGSSSRGQLFGLEGLAHAQEGTALSGGIVTARQDGEVCVDGDRILCHNSCCLAWKAELILEEVHRELAQQFHVPPVASTQLERACYVVAFERWSQHQEQVLPDVAPLEEPELQLMLLQEFAKRLLGIEKQENKRWRGTEEEKAPVKNSWVESISMNEILTEAFEEVTQQAKDADLPQESYHHLLGLLQAQLLESVELRTRLQDAAVEVQYLQAVLKEQAIDFGSALRPVTSVSGEDTNALLGPKFTAALVSRSLAALPEATSDALLMQCSAQKILELRQLLQHELAFRCLAVACIQQNSLLLDPQTKSKELTEIAAIGLSRDVVASDGGLGVMRRLRELLEISGHDKNHPHAQLQPDQEFLTSTHSHSELSKQSLEEKSAAIMDMSRYAQYLQQPARYLDPVLASLRSVWAENDSLRRQRLLRFKLLRCSALLLMRSACDLVVAVQVAQSSNELASMVVLLPKSITPFSYGDRGKPMVERDGQVTSIFSLPSTFDGLQLKALGAADLGGLAKGLAEAEDLDFEKELSKLRCSGPAVVALEILNLLAQLFEQRYAQAMLEADPVCLLEAQRQSRSPSVELEQLFAAHTRTSQDRSEESPTQGGEREIDTGEESRAGPGYEAMEELCGQFGRTVARLHALGPENCKKPSKVVALLRSELCCAQRHLAVLLRRATLALVAKGHGEACGLRRWTAHVEERHSTRPWLRALAPPEGEAFKDVGDLRPLVARLFEEAESYPKQFHPSLCDKRKPFVAALEGPFILPERSNSQHILRMPWRMPRLPTGLLRLPLSLNSERRQQLAQAKRDLELRLEALEKDLAADSDEAVYVESEMYGLMLLRERLSEVLVTEHLGWSKLPSDGVKMAEEVLALPPLEPAVPLEVSAAWELDAAAVYGEMKALRKQLKAMVPALAQLLLSTAIQRLSEEFSALLALKFRLQTRSKAPEEPQTAVAHTVRHEEALLTGGPFAAKLDGLQPVAELLTKSTYVRMDNDPQGEAAHVLKEVHINACIEDLTFGLWSRGRLMSRTREQRTQDMLGLMDHVQEVLWFQSARLEVETIQEGHSLEMSPELDWLQASPQKEKGESMEAQFRAEVASRAVKLVFEADRVQRCQRDLKAAAAELQSRLEAELSEQVRRTVTDFTGALAAEDGRFHESHCSSGEVMQERLRDLREHVTAELAALAAKNQAVQMKAVQPRQVPGLETLLPEKDTGGIDFQTLVNGLENEEDHRQRRPQRNSVRMVSEVKPAVLTVSDNMYGKLAEVASRREVHDMQMELRKLRERQLLERIFHKFKCQAMRLRFEHKAKEAEATLESNSLLLRQLSEISRSELEVSQAFVRGAQEVSEAEQRTEELGPLTKSNAEQKRRLLKWKKNKSKQLFHMRKGVRDHELAGTMDVASLLLEIQSKQELVKMLQQRQREFDDEVLQASRSGLSRSFRVRRAMMEQRRAKDDTFRELQELRAAMQRPDGAKNVDYWRQKVMGLRAEVASLDEENSKLRVLLSMREHPSED